MMKRGYEHYDNFLNRLCFSFIKKNTYLNNDLNSQSKTSDLCVLHLISDLNNGFTFAMKVNCKCRIIS